MIVKKYSNRRLYDTDESRYITLEELTEKVRRGTDVEVIDAKTGADLTQATLTQIMLETKAAKLLPTPLLARLIRMQDDALAEFFGKYLSAALEVYLSAKQGAQAVAPYFPFRDRSVLCGQCVRASLERHPIVGRSVARPSSRKAVRSRADATAASSSSARDRRGDAERGHRGIAR